MERMRYIWEEALSIYYVPSWFMLGFVSIC